MINALNQEDHIFVVDGYKKTAFSAVEDPIFLELMSRYVDLSQVKFLRTALGKPFIENSPLHFSLSHSGDLLLVAFSKSPVGIDVEQIKERKYRSRIEQRYGFKMQTVEDFYASWVAREAFIKLTGGSLAQDLARNRMVLVDKTALIFSPQKGYVAALFRKCTKNKQKIFYIDL